MTDILRQRSSRYALASRGKKNRSSFGKY